MEAMERTPRLLAQHGNVEIQYPLPAKGWVFTCEAQVVHRTGRTCFVRGESRDEGSGLVAMAQATFRIIKANAII